MPYDLTRFSLSDMLRCGSELRRVCGTAASNEEAAQLVCQHLYDRCLDATTGARQVVLARFYQTHPFAQLPEDIKYFAQRALGDGGPEPYGRMKCLTLLATVGDQSAWNARRRSRGHQAIPLASVQLVERAPMIAQLIREFGLDVADVVEPEDERGAAVAKRTYGIFYVEAARGSAHIPAQADFVAPYGIGSVFGFGGATRSGDLFATILFTRVHVPREAAERFRNVALDVKSALFRLDPSRVFATTATV